METSREREREVKITALITVGEEGCVELLGPKVHELLENFQDILNLIG